MKPAKTVLCHVSDNLYANFARHTQRWWHKQKPLSYPDSHNLLAEFVQSSWCWRWDKLKLFAALAKKKKKLVPNFVQHSWCWRWNKLKLCGAPIEITCSTLRPTQLVSWCFESSQQQRITSGLNTHFMLYRNYPFHKSSLRKPCFLSLFTVRGHSTREPASSRVTFFKNFICFFFLFFFFFFLILQACTGIDVSHSQHREKKKIGRVLGECRWMHREGTYKQGRHFWQ